MKKGDIYYKPWLYLDGAKSEKVHIKVEEWHVTHITSTKIYLTEKNELTWGKKSKTNGDYGFLPNIPDYCKATVHIKPSEDVSEAMKGEEYFTTQKQAYRATKPLVDLKVKELLRLQAKMNKELSKPTVRSRIKHNN